MPPTPFCSVDSETLGSWGLESNPKHKFPLQRGKIRFIYFFCDWVVMVVKELFGLSSQFLSATKQPALPEPMFSLGFHGCPSSRPGW